MAGGLCFPAFAAEHKGTIKIEYKGEEQPLHDLRVNLYHVGTSGVGGTLTPDFENSGLDLTDLESLSVSELSIFAQSTAAYAKENNIQATVLQADTSGLVSFENVGYGLYLVVPEKYYYLETGSYRLDPFFVSMPNQNKDELLLNPKTKWIDGVEVSSEILREYSGNGFAETIYTGIPEDATFKVNGVVWDQEGLPFETYYTYAKDAYGNEDSEQVAKDDSKPGVYIEHIAPLNAEDIITCTSSQYEDELKVHFKDTIRVIRGVSKNAQFLKQANGSSYIVNKNASLGTVSDDQVALLFDDFLEANYENLKAANDELINRAYGLLKTDSDRKRSCETKYLDLVNRKNGNLYVTSNSTVDIYWPYPEGTDKNTKFELVHFIGMNREYGILGNSDVLTWAKSCEMEKIEVENTENGIHFKAGTNFSPYILSWTTKKGIFDDVNTGSSNGLIVFSLLLVGSGVLILYLNRRMKRKNG